MKICWDNLEKMRYSRKTKKWYYGNATYIYKEKCKKCEEPYLMGMHCLSDFCSMTCSQTGRIQSEETKEKIRKKHVGKRLSKEHKEKISNSTIGISKITWKTEYYKNKIPLYDTYKNQLEWCEEIRSNKEDINILEVKCTYCGKWYIPTIGYVNRRIRAIYGKDENREQRFYCSDGCKKACPIYGKQSITLMREDAIRAGRLNWLELNREVQPELRQMVLKRDDYTCQKCNNIKELYCHHILPVANNPIESADMDNCITLCKKCHKEVHKMEGCGYGQLRICIEQA